MREEMKEENHQDYEDIKIEHQNDYQDVEDDFPEPEEDQEYINSNSYQRKQDDLLRYEERLPVTGKTKKGSRKLISNVRL